MTTSSQSSSIAAHLTERLRSFRQEKGLDAAALDRLIGARAGTVAKMENGRRQIYVGELYRLADALEKPVTAFFPDPPPVDGNTPNTVPPEEARALVEAFQSLKNPKVRKRISDLIKSVSQRPPRD